MAFIRNYNNSWEDEWLRHLQKEEYVGEIVSAISATGERTSSVLVEVMSKETAAFRQSLAQSSRENVEAVANCASVICGDLNDGFQSINNSFIELRWGLQGIENQLEHISTIFDWKFSLLIEHQQLTNSLLKDIITLLRVPDIQKERQYHLEQGIKFLISAFSDSQFYEDALKNFKEVVKREETDYFALYKLGLIYMHSPHHCNLTEAKKYFVAAAKYNLAERISVGVNNRTGFQISIGAKANLFAARSCYLLQQYNEAIRLADAALAIKSEMGGAHYIKAQALCALENGRDAAVELEKAIEIERLLCLAVLFDRDLNKNQHILDLLKRLRKKETDRAFQMVTECKSLMIPGSRAESFLTEIDALVQDNLYLSSRRANDMLNEVRVWKFGKPSEIKDQKKIADDIIFSVDSLRKLKYFKSGNQMIPFDNSQMLPLIEYLNRETQWTFPLEIGFSWSKMIQEKELTSSLSEFLEKEKLFDGRLEQVAQKTRMEVRILADNDARHKKILLEQEKLQAQEKRRSEIAEKKAAALAEDRNFRSAVWRGIGGAIIGFLIGAVISLVVGGLLALVLSIFIDVNYANKVAWVVIFIILITCCILGAKVGFDKKQE